MSIDQYMPDSGACRTEKSSHLSAQSLTIVDISGGLSTKVNMIAVKSTAEFRKWLADREEPDRAVIVERITRLRGGLAGDSRSVGGRVSELRIHYGPGFRLYYTRRGREFYILLCGGTKRTQKRDIAKAQLLAAAIRGGEGMVKNDD
ncbi:MAG: hypothetical protein LC634_05220 [Sphingomonadales bacterium]|nr:hypothetical protein [Sphingomonadales bacterium]